MMDGNSFGYLIKPPSQARAPDRLFEKISFASDGTAVVSGSGNVLGSFVSIGTAVADLAGFDVILCGAGSTSMRVQFQIRINGTTVIVPNYHVNITANNTACIRFPIAIPAGTTFEIATRCSSATTTLRAALQGVAANTYDVQGYASMTAVSVDTANTRAGSLVLPGDGTWQTLIASTSNVRALMIALAEHSTAPATGQRVNFELGIGAAGSEVPFWYHMAHVAISAPYMPMINPPIIQRIFPDTTRIAARAIGPVTTDSYRMGAWSYS